MYFWEVTAAFLLLSVQKTKRLKKSRRKNTIKSVIFFCLFHMYSHVRNTAVAAAGSINSIKSKEERCYYIKKDASSAGLTININFLINIIAYIVYPLMRSPNPPPPNPLLKTERCLSTPSRHHNEHYTKIPRTASRNYKTKKKIVHAFECLCGLLRPTLHPTFIFLSTFIQPSANIHTLVVLH